MPNSNNFIERSILEILSFFRESVFADDYAARDGFLQRRNARLKTISFLLLLIGVLFARDLYLIFAVYFLVLALTVLSRINLWFFLKRTWIFIPLFSLVIVLPIMFTRQGMAAAALFVARVTTSVSLSVLLALTTRHNELLRVLRVLRVPQIFVMVLGMCYRYIYLFAEVVENTYLAIKSRVGGRVHHRVGRKIVAWSIASLWQRSYFLSSQVYNAMLSRGYRGEPKVLDEESK